MVSMQKYYYDSKTKKQSTVGADGETIEAAKYGQNKIWLNDNTGSSPEMLMLSVTNFLHGEIIPRPTQRLG